MNRISAVAEAVDYEIKRQKKCKASNEKIVQETRGWSDEKSITVSQRIKEESNDYRYFPEPDIPPLNIDIEWINEIKNLLPELPKIRKEKYINKYGLSEYDSDLLTSDIDFSNFFEKVIDSYKNNKSDIESIKYIANLMNGEFNRLLNIQSINFDELKFQPSDLANLVEIYFDKKINNKILKIVLEEMWNSGSKPKDIISNKKLAIISDTNELEDTISNIIENNPKAVEDFKAGKEQSQKFLLGQVMKETKGQADPKISSEIITKILEKK